MKKYLFLSFISFIFINSSFAQAILKGQVTSKNQALEFVDVVISNLNLGGSTNRNGLYSIENIPEGKHIIQISYLGYETIFDTILFNKNEVKTINYALAQNDLLIDEIVIIDEQSGLTSQTPYSISTLSAQNIQLKGNPAGLMGALKEEPGIYGAELGQGIVKPFIRGLGFSRVVTIYQGNKLENHQWGADHGLGINDLGVKKMEVIKGPASILYGSGAIGGVIIAKDNEDYLYSTDLKGNVGFTYNSISGGLRPHISLGKSFKNGFFLAADGAYENHADYKDGNGRIIGNSRFNTNTFRFHTGVQKEKFQNKLSYSYHRQQLGIIEDGEMNDDETLATTRYDREMQLPFQDVSDHIISYKQTTQHEKFETALNVSHHINDRNEIEEDFNDIDLGLLQSHTFYNGRISFKPKGIFDNSIGIQGSFINFRNKDEAEEILMPDAKIFENGLYYLAGLTLGKYYLQGGLRYDYRIVNADANAQNLVDYGFVLPGSPENRKLNRNFQGFTGSLGLTRKIKEKNTLKFNISTGYRAPDLAELFSNGPHPGTNRFEIGNAEFDREQSYQADINYIFESKKFTAASSIFGNIIENYIFFVGSGQQLPSGLEIWEFRQADAILYGGEINFNYMPFEDDRLILSATAAIVRGERLDIDENLTFIPADNYNFSLSLKPFENLNTQFNTNFRYIANQTRPGFGELNTDGYGLLNLGMNHRFDFKKQALNLGLSVFNLLDITYFDHMSILRAFEVTAPGRNVMVNLQYRF